MVDQDQQELFTVAEQLYATKDLWDRCDEFHRSHLSYQSYFFDVFCACGDALQDGNVSQR
jgi:hypothetical protein